MPPLTDDAPELTMREQAALARTLLGKRCKAISKETWGGSAEDYTFEFIPTEILIQPEDNRVVVRIQYRNWGSAADRWNPASAAIDNYHWEVLNAA